MFKYGFILIQLSAIHCDSIEPPDVVASDVTSFGIESYHFLSSLCSRLKRLIT